MCLINEKKSRKKKKPVVGYQLMIKKSDTKYTSLFASTLASTTFKTATLLTTIPEKEKDYSLGKLYTAKWECDSRRITMEHKTESVPGFHAFTNKEDAKRYLLSREFMHKPTIVKGEYYGIISEGDYSINLFSSLYNNKNKEDENLIKAFRAEKRILLEEIS